MGRPLSRTDCDDLSRIIHKQNAICSHNLLNALKANHGDLPCSVEATVVEDLPPIPLPPIPNVVIAEAAKVAFPKYLSRVEAIQRSTLTEFPNMTLMELRSQRRTKMVVKARQISMYLAKTLTEQSLPEIGRRFGGRDHTTVLHAVRKIERLVSIDTGLAAQIQRIKEIIPEAAP